MAKKRKNNSYSKAGNGSLLPVLVIVLVLIIGGGTIFALTRGNTDGGTSPTGGQSSAGGQSSTGGQGSTGGQDISSLESQVQNLTNQVKSNPKDAALQEGLGTALFNLANLYRQANDPRASETLAKTIQVYTETIKLEPDNKETLGDLATAYFYTNQVDQAIATVEKALEIDPAFAPALVNYAIYLANGKGDYLNAIKQLEKVPNGAELYNDAQSLLQQYKEASSKGNSK